MTPQRKTVPQSRAICFLLHPGPRVPPATRTMRSIRKGSIFWRWLNQRPLLQRLQPSRHMTLESKRGHPFVIFLKYLWGMGPYHNFSVYQSDGGSCPIHVKGLETARLRYKNFITWRRVPALRRLSWRRYLPFKLQQCSTIPKFYWNTEDTDCLSIWSMIFHQNQVETFDGQ